MGELLEKYFEFVRKEGGVQAQVRLSLRMRIASTDVGEMEDDPETIEKCKEVVTEIVGRLPDEPFHE